MGGIKSAIELAMERTRGLVMDAEERNALAAREMESKIKAVVRRYLEGIIEGNGVDKELAGIKGDESLKRSLLMDLLVDDFDILSENQRLLELFNFTDMGLNEPFRQELERMQKDFAKEMEKQEAGLQETITERLKKMGITGSAIEPNIPEWDEWREAGKEAGNAFKGRLMAWKNKRMEG